MINNLFHTKDISSNVVMKDQLGHVFSGMNQVKISFKLGTKNCHFWLR